MRTYKLFSLTISIMVSIGIYFLSRFNNGVFGSIVVSLISLGIFYLIFSQVIADADKLDKNFRGNNEIK